jgi:hypothetical protein
MVRLLAAITLLFAVAGCVDDEIEASAGGPGGGAPTECGDDAWRHEDGSCAQLPFLPGCPPGSYELDGECAPAGVPASLCGDGFESDSTGGCVAIAPDAPCGDGMMAVLGETVCRAVAECGQGTWGTIGTDSNTQFVDANYTGGGNDGSQNAPWVSIQAAVDAAADGAVVAIAAGTYVGNLDINGKAVRLWGRCPDMVDVVGTSQLGIFIRGAADGAELRGFAVRNDGIAIFIAAVQDVVFHEMWIHDVGSRALQLDTIDGPASVTVRHSLIERASDVAVISFGGDVVLEASEVRDTRPKPDDDKFGRALAVQVDPDSGLRASALVTSTIVRNNRDVAIWASAASLTIENSWLVDTQPRQSDGRNGVGIGSTAEAGGQSTVNVRSSVIERQHHTGAYALGSHISFDGVVIRDIEPQLSDGEFGRGVTVDTVEAGVRASLNMSRSLVSNTHQIGVAITAADVMIDKVLVRGVGAQQSNNYYGRAVSIQDDLSTGERGVGAITHSELLRFAETGIMILSSDITIDRVEVSEPTKLTDSVFGDGILVWALEGATTATIRTAHVHASARAGISSFGGDISVASSWLECNPIDLNGDNLPQRNFNFTDGGGNLCGCDRVAANCKLQSLDLEPPSAPAP